MRLALLFAFSIVHAEELPAGAQRRFGSAAMVHAGAVTGVAFAGGKLAARSLDGRVVVRDALSGEVQKRLCAEDEGLGNLGSTEQLFIAPCDGGLRAWKADLSERWFLRQRVSSVAVAGRRTLAAKDDAWLLLETKTGVVLRRFQGDFGQKALALSRDSAALGGSEELVVLDIESGEVRWKKKGLLKEIEALAYSPDGTALAAGGRGDHIAILDAQSGAVRRRLESPHGQAVDALAFSPDGALLASGGGMEEDVVLWDTSTWKPRATVDLSYHAVAALAFSSDGKYLAAGDWDYRASVIEVASARRVRVGEGHERPARHLALAPGGRLLSSGEDDRLIAWDLESGKRLAERDQVDRGSLAVLADGTIAATVHGGTNTALLDAKLTEIGHLEIGDGPSASSGDRLAIASGSRITLFTGRQRRATLQSDISAIFALAMSGHTLVAVGEKGIDECRIEIWELEKRRASWRGHPKGSCNQAALSRHLLATGSHDELRLWNIAEEPRLLRSVRAPERDFLTALAFDGKTVATGGMQGGVRFYSTEGKLLATRTGHIGTVNALLFLPDRRLISAGNDGSLLLWAPP